MGFFSGVKKLVSKAAPIVGTVIGGMYGNPAAGAAAGSAFGGLFGGGDKQTTAQGGEPDIWGSLGSLASSAYDIYSTNKNRDTAYRQALQGIESQNSAAALMAHQANLFSAEQAQKQMDFQERMSSTAHQREVTDLRAAGLNPLLSGTGGMGSSSPSGAQGSVAVAPVQDTGKAVNTALEAMKAFADTQKLNATTKFIQGAQTEATSAGAEASRAGAQSSLSTAALNRVKAAMTGQQITNLQQDLKNLKAMETNIRMGTGLKTAQRNQVMQATKNLEQTFRTLHIEGNISEEDYQFWQQTIGGASKSAQSMGNLLHMLKSLIK